MFYFNQKSEVLNNSYHLILYYPVFFFLCSVQFLPIHFDSQVLKHFWVKTDWQYFDTYVKDCEARSSFGVSDQGFPFKVEIGAK